MRTGASRSGTCLMATTIFISTFHKSWVPHPCRVFVFAARVKKHDPHLIKCNPSRLSAIPALPTGQYREAPARLRLSPPAHPETWYCRRGRPRRLSRRRSQPVPPRARGSRARRSPRPETTTRRLLRNRSCARASAALPPVHRPARQPVAVPRKPRDTAPDSTDRGTQFFLGFGLSGSRSANRARNSL